MLRLYSYFRSTAAYRVRIALELKGLDYDIVPVHLVEGAQRTDDYRAVNPQGLVPTLVDGDTVIGNSPAILEYIEERHPAPSLLPAQPAGRARVRQIAALIACDIHPLNNLRVLKRLKETHGIDPLADGWYAHWVEEGFTALEALLAGSAATGLYCHGDSPTFADLYLAPQVYNARRFDIALDPYPVIERIDAACNALEPFRRAAPDAQPDAPKEA